MITSCKKILVAPDKFKGSLTADGFCAVAEKALGEIFCGAQIYSRPMADGGEGSLDCFVRSTGADIIEGEFTNSDFKKINARYAVKDGVAFIETAQTAGLMNTSVKNPLLTTTLGVGEQIFEAVSNGARKIYLAMGGSSTNDAGCGMAVSLGYKFLNSAGEEFVPTGGTLCEITDIIFPPKTDIAVTALCDVKNPLYGENGAAFVYAGQKGADSEQIKQLDKGLSSFNSVCKKYGFDFSSFPGAGAAGGLGAGAVMFLGARLKSGTESFFEISGADKIIPEADLIISGEGRLDSQSEYGKVVCSLYEKCKGKNFTAFCGVSEMENPPFDVIEINKKGESLEQSLKNTRQNLYESIKEYFAKEL